MITPKIDWYEFIIHNPLIEPSVGEGDLSQILMLLSQLPNLDCLALDPPVAWHPFPGKGIWGQHWQNTRSKTSIFLNRDYSSFKVALSGDACDYQQKRGDLDKIIAITHTTCCRIDYAVDIHYSSPELARQGATSIAWLTYQNGARVSHSEAHSQSGDTFYFGSWNSERYARCYHYNEPHPRCHLVRLEAVYRGAWAKRSLEEFGNCTLATIVKSALLPYKWKGINLDEISEDTVEMRLPRSDKEGGTHTRWVYTVCIPSLREAVRNGEVTREFLEKELFGAMKFE